MRATGAPKTLASQLRAVLAEEIASGKLAAGATLDEMELARRFDVSRTPVREAIRLLAASGLVVTHPHRSALVAQPTGSEILDLFEALREIEALCAGLAAERMTADEQQRLRDLNRRLAELACARDRQAYHESDEAFHAAIWTGAHNDALAEIATATRARIAMFCRAQFQAPGRLATSHAEHEGIIAAIAAGDGPAATVAMRAHIRVVQGAQADSPPGV